MAQFNKDNQTHVPGRLKIHDVSMIATKDGNIISNSNPLPVDIGTSNIVVTDGGNSITVDGNVGVLGTVDANVSGNVNINNFPTTQTVNGNVFATIVSNVNIDNFPTTQTVDGSVDANVSGNVNIDNFPTTQTVDGSVDANVSGNVNIDNFPTTQTVDGTVNVAGNVNVTQGTDPWTVDGTVGLNSATLTALENTSVTVNNFPTSQTVNGTVTIQDGGESITIDGAVSATQSGDWDVNILGTPTVDVGNIPSITVNNTSGNPIPITDAGGSLTIDDGGGSITIDGTVTVTGGSTQSTFSKSQIDAFGRLRVSEPRTIFDGSFRYSDDPNKWDTATTGEGNTNFLVNESTVTLNVSGGNDEVIRETKRVFKYQPGKSLLVMSSFVLNNPKNNLRQRVGYFGEDNGIYFQTEDTVKSLVIRKKTSGTVDDTSEKVTQSNWNGDKLDGTGPSGHTIDFSRAQIFWMDIEWLGVGSVRTGFVIDGEFIVCHTFHHANILDKVYMTTGTLPLRYEITSIGSGTSGTLRQICSTVMSEGGHENISMPRSAHTSLSGKALSTSVYRPLVAIRLKSSRLDSVVVPSKFDVFGLQNAAFKYVILLNPSLSGTSWTSAGSDSAVEYDISATSLSGGTVIDSGIFVGSSKGATVIVTPEDGGFSQQLGRKLNGVSDIYVLAVIATTSNDDAAGSITWQEH